MVDFTSALMTTMIGMLGVVIGAIISNYVNQRIAAKSARRDLIFKKKVDYFDRTVSAVEHNIKLYTIWIRKIESKFSKKEVDKAIENLKQHRSKFDVMTSALYLDVDEFTHDIKQFVALEKQIFALFELLKADNHERVIEKLRKCLYDLKFAGRDVINKMRSELVRE